MPQSRNQIGCGSFFLLSRRYIMQQLIQSYQKSIRETEQAVAARQQLYDLAVKKKDVRKYLNDSSLAIYKSMTLEQLEKDIKILNASLNSMRHAVIYMLREQHIHQHMNFKKLANKEYAYDPEWMKQFKSESSPVIDKEQQELQQQKAKLIKSMVSTLSKKQILVLELIAAQYTHEEIAAMLNVREDTVKVTVRRIRRAIEDEGWFMP